MFRDSYDEETSLGSADLSAVASHSIVCLFGFIDKTISGFRQYYFSGVDISSGENPISYHLSNYFNSCLADEQDGFIPYKFCFVKNPPQNNSKRETDIGVIILNKNRPTPTIAEFEAKRLSDDSNNSEYVYGDTGGVERFKRNFHAAHLNICGMFGYVQICKSNYWVEKINGWMDGLVKNNSDTTIVWEESDKLVSIETIGDVSKHESINSRKDSSTIKLYHYLINLVK